MEFITRSRPGWDDPIKTIEHLSTQNEPNTDGETIAVQFNDDPSRVATLERWGKERDAWKDAELPVRAAMAVFDKFYALHGRMAA